MIWRAILIIVGVPAAAIAGICIVCLLFASPALLAAGYLGWIRRDVALDYATLPVLFLAACAAVGVVVQFAVSRFDIELGSMWWISYWWRRLWRSPPDHLKAYPDRPNVPGLGWRLGSDEAAEAPGTAGCPDRRGHDEAR
ncbi:hypothetical protein [Methylobacterium dankookense]|uniref:hypothetical protein n=1 Tax=Methylobacterium dankookense TaxID=560405 RepID=UPI00119CDD25|nr:hypothetical protein [Methylobacterium dankookense]